MKTRLPWKPLLAGFVLGVLACGAAFVLIAWRWAPRGQSIEVDLYSGRTRVGEWSLWKKSQRLEPMDPAAQWATNHLDPPRSWYLFAAGTSRNEWFADMEAVDTTTSGFVPSLYALPLSDAEKVELLRQYHADLDVLQQKLNEPDFYQTHMAPFCARWKEKVQL